MSNNSRNFFFEELGKHMKEEDIYIVSADLAGPPFDYIREKFPQRYIPVGIAEQNLISVACGIALTGKKVVAYTSNPFVSLRGFDQIRNAVTLMSIPLAIVGVGTGFSISNYGTTHYTTEDIAMTSLCPGLDTISVSDCNVAEMIVNQFLRGLKKPCYIRFDKDCNGSIGCGEVVDFIKGWRYLTKGREKVIVAQGYTSQLVAKISSVKVMPSIVDVFKNPFDEKSFVQMVSNYDKVIVVEEQQRRGGLGSIVLEMLNDWYIHKEVKRIGIDYGTCFPEVYGSREYWMNWFGITEENIRKNLVN